MNSINQHLDYLYWCIKHRKGIPYYIYKILKYRDVGKAQEMFFWKKRLIYSHNVFSDKDPFEREDDMNLILKIIASNFKVSGKNIKVLEIGPGPRSTLEKNYTNGDFDLIAIDPLADDYKKEFDGGAFLVSGMGEDVKTKFSQKSFHMVYASNSLDHCRDPHEVVEGVIHVLKPQGLFVICGNEREGSRVNWQGFHKHDLWLQGDVLFHSGKNNNVSKLIDEGFSLITKRDLVYDWKGQKIKWFSGIWEKVKT